MAEYQESGSTEQPKENLFEKALADSILERAKADSGSDLLAESDDGLNTLKTKFKAFHELGKHVLAEGTQLPEVVDKNLYALLGSVDQVKHKEVSNREAIIVETRDGQDVNWYQSKVEAAGKFLELDQYVDVKSFGFSEEQYGRIKILVEAVASMTEYTDAKWDELVAGKLSEGYTKDEIYGEKGVLNVLLAFQRAIVAVPADMLVEEKFKVTEKNPTPLFVGGIQLKIGKKGGERPKDRCTMLIEWAKNVEKEQEEEAARKAAEEEEARKKAEEEAAKKAEEEAAKKAAEEEAAKKKAEADEAAKKSAEEAKKKAEEDAKKKAEEAKKKAEEDAKKKEEEAKKAKEAEEARKKAEEEAKKKLQENTDAGLVKLRLEELKRNGFEVVNAPSKIGGTAYAKYGKKRVNITFLGEMKYNFSLLTLPRGRDPVGGTNVTVSQMKAALDAAGEFNDEKKVMYEDLRHLSYNMEVSPLTGGTPDTYSVTVKGYRHESAKGEISDPVDLQVEVTLNERLGYTGYTKNGRAIKRSKDAGKFMKSALKRAYLEQKAQ